MPIHKETVSLFDSSAQEDRRESSTLAHFAKGAYIQIGDKIEQIYDRKYKKKLAYARFLDIGCGHGSCLAYMHQVYKVWSVGVEVCPNTFQGSINLLKEIQKVRKILRYNIY